MKNQEQFFSDPNLEKNVIGCLLLDNKICNKIKELIDENCFTIKTYQIVFNAIIWLISENKIADPFSVYDFIKEKIKELDGTFTETSLLIIENEVYSIKNALIYATHLSILSKKRIRKALIDELSTCQDDSRISEITASLKDINLSIQQPENTSPIVWDDLLLPTIKDNYFKIGNNQDWFWDMILAVRDTTETPLEIVFGVGLSVLATALQKKFIVEIHPSYYEPLNLWTLGALGPGNRKSAIVKSLIRPLNTWESCKYNEIAPEIKQKEKLLLTASKNIAAEIIIPKIPRLLTMDVTPEKLAMIMAENGEKMSIIAAEGGIFELMAGKYSRSGPNLDVFNQAHIGDRIRIDRATRETIIMENPALTFGLLAQPSVITSFATIKEFRDKGTLGRYLYFVPSSNLGKRTLNFKSIPKEIEEKYISILTQMLDYQVSEPIKLYLDNEAFALWKEFCLQIEKDIAPGGRFESIIDWAAKYSGLILRICGLMHCAFYASYGINVITQNNYNIISKSIMEKIINLTPVFTSHALAAFGLLSEDEPTIKAKKILEWIKKNNIKTFLRRECFHGLHRNFKNMQELNQSLRILCDREFIKLIHTKWLDGKIKYSYIVS